MVLNHSCALKPFPTEADVIALVLEMKPMQEEKSYAVREVMCGNIHHLMSR